MDGERMEDKHKFGKGLWIGGVIGFFIGASTIGYFWNSSENTPKSITSVHLESPKGNYLKVDSGDRYKPNFFIESSRGNYIPVEDFQTEKKNDLLKKLKEAENKNLNLATPSLNDAVSGELGE